tara:strand:- start:270 stop:920 length:651 start_codon:yes stop_codon:yes gene_type:complete
MKIMKLISLNSKDLDSNINIKSKVIFVMPYIDEAQKKEACEILLSRASFSDATLIAVNDNSRKGFVSIVNSVFSSTASDLFGYLASDIFPSRNWLNYSVQMFKNQQIGLLAYNDGKWFGALASFGLARRSWIKDFYQDNFFYFGYKSHYADTELSALASATNSLGYNANIIMMEIDYKKDAKQVNINDKKLFAQRMNNFIKSEINWQNPQALSFFK